MSLINHPKLSNHLCIFFDKLEFQTSIGIHEHEMRKKQSVIICIEMYFPLSSASPKKDSINEVLDYDTIREGIEKIINEKHFYLCLLYTSPSPRDKRQSRMPSSA